MSIKVVNIWCFLLYNLFIGVKSSLKYTAAWFTTLTFKRWTSKDDVEIAVHKFLRKLGRFIRGHLMYKVGYEYGENAHVHLIIYWKEYDYLDAQRMTLLMQDRRNSEKLWEHGGVKHWDDYREEIYGHRGLFYVNSHIRMEDCNEVICGNNRCHEREKARELNQLHNVV